MKLCASIYGTFLQNYNVPYCTFRGSFKGKCPESGAKTHIQYVTVAHFYYVGTGTYCCVFIMLEVRIADVQN